MFSFHKRKEKERLEKGLFDELLEYHFEKTLGENEHNRTKWRVLLEDGVEPHTDILCDFSEWLIGRGWDREAVEEVFFVVIKGKAREDKQGGGMRGLRRMFSWLRAFIP